MYVFLVMGFVLLNALVVPPILPGYSTSIGFRENGNSEIGFILVFSLHYRLVLARMEWLQSKTPISFIDLF